MNLSFSGDRIGKLHELSAVFSICWCFCTSSLLLGHCDALGVFAFHPFKRERSAGRIKIKQLGTILLYVYPPAICYIFGFKGLH